MPRVFTDVQAIRKSVPLFLGVFAPPGGGKTKSGLRLAMGIKRVVPGEVYVLDADNGKAAHYAPAEGEEPDGINTFAFRHVRLDPPHGSLDYLAALEFIASKKPAVTVIDGLSPEHDRYLEFHSEEQKRLLPVFKTEDKASMAAWQQPSLQRQKLLRHIEKMPGNFIFCFRAREKIYMRKPGEAGDDRIVDLGWMPVAGDEFLYLMTVCCLVMPGAKGVPTWQTAMPGEKRMIRDPEQFAWLYSRKGPLDEGTGEALAKWAAGGTVAAPPAPAAAPSPPPPAAPAGPAKDDLAALTKVLVDAGIGTSDLRRQWIAKTIGHPLTSLSALTRSELDACMQAAKEI